VQANPAGSSAQALGFLGLTGLQFLTKKLSPETRLNRGSLAGLGLLQPLHTLLDQHLGHVAHRAGLGIREFSQLLAELLGQHHLNAR
jgi:hypothetical protein